MVIWVYAGGGPAESAGFVPFLQRHLPHNFQRRTPARMKPGPKPPRVPPGATTSSVVGQQHHPRFPSGCTGPSLARQIRDNISAYWDGTAEAVLVLDDTDEADPPERIALLRGAVEQALRDRAALTEEHATPIVVALAVPELEVWLLADWKNTFRRQFPDCHTALRHELSTRRGFKFEAPESFRVRDDEERYHKLSEELVDAIRLICHSNPRYSKATDTPTLLQRIDPAVVSRKCPHFRRFWTALSKLGVDG